jgi:hypothetical protein
MNKRDKNKRLKGFGIPVELCVRYERMAGVKTGEEPTRAQQQDITRLMVTALTVYAADVVLTSADYQLIKEEVEANERNR